LEVVAAVELAVPEDPAEAPVAEAVEPEPEPRYHLLANDLSIQIGQCWCVRHEPLAVPDAEEPVPVGALPEAVGVAPALEPELLMQLSTQDYFTVNKMIDNWPSLKITYLVVGVVSYSAISLGAIGNAIGNGIGLVTLRDTFRSAAVVAGGAWSGEY
jgi:hypothetical protein